MGSTSYITKPKSTGYRAKSGSSVGSDKEMNGKLRRTKIRRPSKMTDYGIKRIPDYTELAYKEAVSKLRYFLSGNYAPSVRSYAGSASVKNLEESDGDLDKKYIPTYNVLTEYKPRPRLTAKYATLYADSLNNYASQNLNNVVVPPPATTPAAVTSDLTGGTNPDVLNFIQKQEEYIEQLERESQYCRDELNNLLGKVKEVISENEHLHEAQKNKLISRMFHSYTAGSETDDLDDLGDSTGLDSDNKADATPSKTRKTSKTRASKLEGPNIVFESRIAELEAQLAQAKIDFKKLQEENNENKRKLASGLVDSTCFDGFKRQIDNLQRDKSSLETQISKLKHSLEQREGDLGYKRGSDVIEQQLREERNNLESEIRRLKDELAKERGKVRELAGEGARRVFQERSAAEQRYNAHFDELQHDLTAQYENIAKLQLEMERQRREENELKRELSMKNNAIEELKMELKNKTASLQADLAQAYAEKASLEEELASARLAIERHQRQAKHETNRLNSEIQSLRQRLDRGDADLVHSRRENLRLSEQIANLEKELNMKNLTPISPEKKKKEKELSTMLESMENKHAKTVAELDSMIQSQNSLMEKLTGECRLLTDKLDDANRRHKEELATLQRQVEKLGRSLQTTHSPSSTYQAPTTHTPSTNGNDSHVTSDTGRNYTRTDSPRHTQEPGDQPVSRIEQNRFDDNTTTSRNLSRQASKASVKNLEHEDPIHNSINNDLNPNQHLEQRVEGKEKAKMDNELDEDKDKVEKVMDLQHEQEYDPRNYEGYENYDQNYDPVANNDYQNQNYDQNYEQSHGEDQTDYSQGQYEQYPQYNDPNTQYEEKNYENYATDQNYDQSGENYDQSGQNYDQSGQNYDQSGQNYDQSGQNYDNTQYNQENTAQIKEQVNKPIESKRSNSPNEKFSNHS